jgi:anaerobic selenocysteine-containing dehydrogenase
MTEMIFPVSKGSSTCLGLTVCNEEAWKSAIKNFHEFRKAWGEKMTRDFARTTCTQDCSDVCGLLVRSGEQSAVRGDPDHPFTAGFICSRVKGIFHRLQSVERILKPRLRVDSWERAMGLCADRLGAALKRDPASVLHIQGHGAKGVLQEATGHVFAQLGARATCGSFCDDTGIEASIRDFGALDHNRIEDLANAGTIVNWGRDLYRGSVHLAAVVRRARKAGTPVISICPGGKEYYEYSDEVIRVRPGRDRFLACAVIRRLQETGRIPQSVLAGTLGWGQKSGTGQ